MRVASVILLRRGLNRLLSGCLVLLTQERRRDVRELLIQYTGECVIIITSVRRCSELETLSMFITAESCKTEATVPGGRDSVAESEHRVDHVLDKTYVEGTGARVFQEWQQVQLTARA